MRNSASVAVIEPLPLRPSPFVPRWLRRSAKNIPALAGASVLLLVFAAALLGPIMSNVDPIATDTRNQLLGPGLDHWFGTDNLGRDLFTRVLYGTRTSLMIGFGAVFVGTGSAVAIGVTSAYFGGRYDLFVQRVVDAMMAMPWLIVAMSVLSLAGSGSLNLVLVVGLLMAFNFSRVMRSATLVVRQQAYIEACRSVGCSTPRLILRHVLPNVFPTAIVLATVGLGSAILTEAALSFLGFGVAPPEPSLGQMLGVDGRRWMLLAPWLAIFPGVALSLAVFGFNMFGDGLRDLLDPRLRNSR